MERDREKRRKVERERVVGEDGERWGVEVEGGEREGGRGG